MRSAIARRLLFCRAYRQLKVCALPRHNRAPEWWRRYMLCHRLIQWQFVSIRRARRVQRLIEAESGYCIWLGPWWGRSPPVDLSDLPSFEAALGIEEDEGEARAQ